MLNVLLHEQRRGETSIENVTAAIERGVITNTTTKRLKELEARQEELDKQIIMEKSKNAVRVSEDRSTHTTKRPWLLKPRCSLTIS